MGPRWAARNGLLGAINILQRWAKTARRPIGWTYSNCRLLSNTPYYIIFGEFGIAVILAVLANKTGRQG
ncbi:MAG: hypothetical protein U0361_07325 [Nitrospiraceae bacterium]